MGQLGNASGFLPTSGKGFIIWHKFFDEADVLKKKKKSGQGVISLPSIILQPSKMV